MQAEDLADPVVQEPGVAVERREPPDVGRGQVQARVAGEDPLGQRPPGPPADAMPTELKPAPTKKFRRPGASPAMNWLSGVKLSQEGCLASPGVRGGRGLRG
ncbi:MAG TPA: hypothetical protein VF933_24230 [Streptosporangiaceae bacterium]